MRYMEDNSSVIVGGRGNQAYVLAIAPMYDEWVRNNYELQVWQTYLKMGTQDKHWAKEVITRTKKPQASATITNLQVQLSTYWTQTTAGAINPITATTSSASANTGRIRDAVDRLEKAILKYIQRLQIEEYKVLEDFKEIATPNQWNIDLMLKRKMKQWSTKNKNYLTAIKRIEYDLPPKFISNANFTFKIDESIISKEEAQILYDQMRQLTKEYRFQAMSLYLQAIAREKQILKNGIEFVVKGFSQENDEVFDIEPDAGYIAFKHYNDLREKRFNLEAEQSIYFLEEQRVEGELNEQEEIVVPTLTRSEPGRSVEKFIAESDVILKNLHDTPISKINRKYKQQRERIPYDNLLETIQLNQYQITKCPITTKKRKIMVDWSSGKLQDYHKKSDEYMEKTEAYK
ncbi:unnamed protein product, partial [Rotaria sp. Silwood1]